MPPVLSLFAILGLLGVAFSFLHHLILWLDLPDLAALLLFAIPVAIYIAWCSFEARAEILAFALRIYLSFSAVVVVSAAIVHYIG